MVGANSADTLGLSYIHIIYHESAEMGAREGGYECSFTCHAGARSTHRRGRDEAGPGALDELRVYLCEVVERSGIGRGDKAQLELDVARGLGRVAR